MSIPPALRKFSKVGGEVLVNVEGSGTVSYVVEVYAGLRLVGSGPQPQPTGPPGWSEPLPVSVVQPIDYGTSRIFMKSGTVSAGQIKIPWSVNANQVFGGLPDGEFEVTFWCKVSVADGTVSGP